MLTSIAVALVTQRNRRPVWMLVTDGCRAVTTMGWAKLATTWLDHAALLQEVREVLALHTMTDPPYGGWGPHHCKRCDETWPCPEAALLQKIDQAVSSTKGASS